MVEGDAPDQTEKALDDPEVMASEAASYVEQGFHAVKMKVGFGIERDVAFVAAVRRAIGDGVQLMVDANHAYDTSTAIALGRAVQPYSITWFEEPVVPEDVDGYRAVRRALDIPIAGGEAEFTRHGFRHLITRGAVDILQPDLCLAGGISEGRKIAALASAWHVRCIPHVWGTGVALAAALHFIAALPEQPPALNSSSLLLELDRTENPLRDNLLCIPIAMDGCYALVPQAPGLGVEVDEIRLREYGMRHPFA